MQSAVATYKLIRKIKDEKFDEENLHHYSLLLQLGVRDFQVGVVDTRDNRFIFFEDYILAELNSSEEQFTLLKSLFESHQLLMAGFWKNVKFSIKNNKFAQVPATLFLEEAAAEYLRFNASIGANDEVLWCKNETAEVVTVFAVLKDLQQWINTLYVNSKVNVVHQSAALIEGIFNYASPSKDNPLYVFIDRFKLHIISVKEQKLLYYNQFPIKHFSDYVKYIMLVLKALEMNQKNSQIMVWGYIGKNSPHSVEFAKYIQNVSFGSRPSKIKFGYMFDEVQDHHFVDLYSMHLLSATQE